jgi:hypothetical protein
LGPAGADASTLFIAVSVLVSCIHRPWSSLWDAEHCHDSAENRGVATNFRVREQLQHLLSAYQLTSIAKARLDPYQTPKRAVKPIRWQQLSAATVREQYPMSLWFRGTKIRMCLPLWRECPSTDYTPLYTTEYQEHVQAREITKDAVVNKGKHPEKLRQRLQ